MLPNKNKKRLYAAGLLVSMTCAPAFAWWPQGHSILSEAAVKASPDELPAFFRAGSGFVGHMAQDPDVLKNRGLPHISDREGPEHYLDYEMLQGHPLPEKRSEYLKLCNDLKIEPSDVGYVPYSVAECTERLAMAFAEGRRWPNNPYIQEKTLVYAGILSHYAEDLCMPLHVTVDHDGRALPNGKSPRTGIHSKVDSLIEKMAFQPQELAKNQKIEPLDDLMPGIMAEIMASRSHIDEAYKLEKQLPPETGAWTASPSVKAFATERARESVRFTASLYLTAWRKSKDIQLPKWLVRESPQAQAQLQKGETTALGNYQVPAIAGWQREATNDSRRVIRSVKYKTEVQETTVSMKFVFFRTPEGVKSPTATDLQANAKLVAAINQDMPQESKFTKLVSQATKYRGQPAYLVSTQSDDGKRISESKILKFVDGKNEGWFFQSLSALKGKQISPEARKSADQAWKTMTEGLK